MDRAKAAFEGALFLKGWKYKVKRGPERCGIECTGTTRSGAFPTQMTALLGARGLILWTDFQCTLPTERHADVILALDLLNGDNSPPTYRLYPDKEVIRLEWKIPAEFTERLSIEQAGGMLDALVKMNVVFGELVEGIAAGREHRFAVRDFLDELYAEAHK